MIARRLVLGTMGRRALRVAAVSAVLVAALYPWLRMARSGPSPFSDEGVVGLMALSILEGRDLPIYFWGQAYFGAVEAYVAALMFAVGGVSTLTLRASPYLFWLGSVALTAAIAGRAWGPTFGWMAALLAALPTLPLATHRGLAFGGYTVLVFLGLLGLWLAGLGLPGAPRRPIGLGRAAGLGCVAGLACWVSPFAAAFLPPTALVAWRAWRWSATRSLAGVVGFAVGSAPTVAYAVAHDAANLRILLPGSPPLKEVWVSTSGRWSLVHAAPPMEGSLVERGQALVALFLQTLAGGSFADLLGVALPAALALSVVAALAVLATRGSPSSPSDATIPLTALGVLALNALGLLATRLGTPPLYERYLIPAQAVWPLLLLWAVRIVSRERRLLGQGLFGLLALGHAVQSLQQPIPSDPLSRNLAELLQSLDIHHFYGPWETTYGAPFVTRGAILGSPKLADVHPERWPQATAAADASPRFALLLPTQGETLARWQARLRAAQAEADSYPVEGAMGRYLLYVRFTVDPRYGWTAPPHGWPPTTPRPVDAFSPGVALRGFYLPSPRVAPGDLLPVALAWQATDPSPPDFRYFLRLAAADGTPLVQADRVPEREPRTWPDGHWARDLAALHVPADAPSGLYRLEIGATGHDGRSQTLVPLAAVTVGSPAASLPSEAKPLDATFGEVLRLRGFHVVRGAARQIAVTLFWQALAWTQERWVVSVQVIDAAGRLRGQHDAEPANGWLPTLFWPPGVLIPDTHRVTLPADADADASLRLVVVVYHRDDLRRLAVGGPLATADGTALALPVTVPVGAR